jgi:hypothetical protein
MALSAMGNAPDSDSLLKISPDNVYAYYKRGYYYVKKCYVSSGAEALSIYMGDSCMIYNYELSSDATKIYVIIENAGYYYLRKHDVVSGDQNFEYNLTYNNIQSAKIFVTATGRLFVHAANMLYEHNTSTGAVIATTTLPEIVTTVVTMPKYSTLRENLLYYLEGYVNDTSVTKRILVVDITNPTVLLKNYSLGTQENLFGSANNSITVDASGFMCSDFNSSIGTMVIEKRSLADGSLMWTSASIVVYGIACGSQY